VIGRCSSAPHLQFAEGTKTHLCIVEQNSPTPVRRWFSLTQEGLGRVIPGDEGPGDGLGLGIHLFVKVPQPGDSEVIFAVFESSCHLFLPV